MLIRFFKRIQWRRKAVTSACTPILHDLWCDVTSLNWVQTGMLFTWQSQGFSVCARSLWNLPFIQGLVQASVQPRLTSQSSVRQVSITGCTHTSHTEHSGTQTWHRGSWEKQGHAGPSNLVPTFFSAVPLVVHDNIRLRGLLSYTPRLREVWIGRPHWRTLSRCCCCCFYQIIVLRRKT